MVLLNLAMEVITVKNVDYSAIDYCGFHSRNWLRVWLLILDRLPVHPLPPPLSCPLPASCSVSLTAPWDLLCKVKKNIKLKKTYVQVVPSRQAWASWHFLSPATLRTLPICSNVHTFRINFSPSWIKISCCLLSSMYMLHAGIILSKSLLWREIMEQDIHRKLEWWFRSLLRRSYCQK